MTPYFLTALQPDPVITYYFLHFWKTCVSKTGAHLKLFWSAGKTAQETFKDSPWLKPIRDLFFEKFTSLPNVTWYEEGYNLQGDIRNTGNFVTHFDAMDYMFADVPKETILVSYDSDVFWWDLEKLEHYLNLIRENKYDIIGCTPAGCGTQIQEEVSKRQPPANVHPAFVIIKTDNFQKVRPQPNATALGRPVRWRPYIWNPGDTCDQLGKVITETTAVDVFGWASLEIFDRLKLNRFYEIKPSPRFQEAFDSFIGEPGWCHLAATSSLIYIWPSILPGLEADIPQWTRGRTLFGVARMLLGFKRILEDPEFGKAKGMKACIKEGQAGLEYMCQVKEIKRKAITKMQERILSVYPF